MTLLNAVRRDKKLLQVEDLLRDLGRLQEASIGKDGKDVTTRAYVEDQVGRVSLAAGIILPSNWHGSPPDPHTP